MYRSAASICFELVSTKSFKAFFYMLFIDALRKADFLRFHFSFLLGKSPNLKEKSELYGSQSTLLHSLYERLTPRPFSRSRLSR